MDRSRLSRMYRAGAPRGLSIEKRIHTPSVLSESKIPIRRMAYTCDSIGRLSMDGSMMYIRHTVHARAGARSWSFGLRKCWWCSEDRQVGGRKN